MKRTLIALFLLATQAHAGQVLDKVFTTHALSCGVVTALNDETKDDTHGDTSAFGMEICRAVAAAAHAHAAAHAYPSEELAYKALQSGEIALIVGASPNPGLARRYGADALNPVFFDTQGLLVHKDQGLTSLRSLAGKQVCFIGDTDAERHLNDATRSAGITIVPFPFEEVGEMEAALVGGRCAAETFDATKLAAGRAAFHGRVHDFDILPDRLSIDPLSPVVRIGDPDWARVVDWVTGALVQAEISGVTRANAATLRTTSQDSLVQILTGARRGLQWGLYLPDDWSLQAIEAVGNYGEVFDRTLGAHSAMRLERGLNRPWTQGGMLWGFENP